MADDLRRLMAVAVDATRHVAPQVSASKLYREAAVVAETRIPGPIGLAIAGVLHSEAYQRDLDRVPGCIGARSTVLSLALAVLELSLTESPGPPRASDPPTS